MTEADKNIAEMRTAFAKLRAGFDAIGRAGRGVGEFLDDFHASERDGAFNTREFGHRRHVRHAIKQMKNEASEVDECMFCGENLNLHGEVNDLGKVLCTECNSVQVDEENAEDDEL